MAEFQVYQEAGQWRWRLRFDTDRVVHSAEGHKTRPDSVRAVKRVRSEIGRARVVEDGTGDLLDKPLPWMRWLPSVVILGLFFCLGTWLVLEIRSAQVATWQSSLSDADQYMWFARLQTTKALITLIALVLGLVGANFLYKATQKSE